MHTVILSLKVVDETTGVETVCTTHVEKNVSTEKMLELEKRLLDVVNERLDSQMGSKRK